MAKSARIRSQIVYISNMFPQNESKQRDFGCHGKRLSCFIVFINKNIESENIELRKLNLNFKLIARGD